MALIVCPECGNQVSERAQACPNCGAPIATSFNIETIVSDIEKELERIRYENAAFLYQNGTSDFRANFTDKTGISTEQVKSVNPVSSGARVNDLIENKLAAAHDAFQNLDDGKERYKSLAFSIVKLVSNEKYHTASCGIFSTYSYAHLVTAINLTPFSEDEVIKLAAMAVRSLLRNNGSRLYLYEFFAKYVSLDKRNKLIGAFGASSEDRIDGEPFFAEALAEWDKCRNSGAAFDSSTFNELNHAAKLVGKKKAIEYVKEKQREKREEEERQRKERIDSIFTEQLIRNGVVKNGKAPASCPSCGSVVDWRKVGTSKKGISAAKAAAGTALAGTAGGVVGGALGNKVDTYRCAKCGFTYDYPHDSNNKSGSEVLAQYKEQCERNQNNLKEGADQTSWGEIGLIFLVAIVLFYLSFQFASCTR